VRSVWLFLPLVLAFALLVSPDVRRAEAAITFSDDFSGPSLGPSWTWQNPGPGSSYSLSGGRLNLTVGANNDQWVRTDKAPKLLKNQSNAPWAIETRVASSSGHGSSLSGLIVYKDAANWISIGWLSNYWLEASGIVNNTFTGAVGVSATKFAHLRIRRLDSRYLFDASGDGINWTNVNSFVDAAGALNGARVGFWGKNWDRALPYTVSFDYFREHSGNVMPSPFNGILSTSKLAQETGYGSINATEFADVCGTDLGVMFDWLDRTYVAFGDTRSCLRSERIVRPNTLAFSEGDPNLGDGLHFSDWIKDDDGEAKALFLPDVGATTAIPSGAIGLDERAYIFYMNVTNWDRQGGSWSCNHASIASAQAADHGTWTKHAGTVRWTTGNFNQLSVLKDANSSTLYVYGTPCGRFGSVKLMKVLESSILVKGAYQYFAGYNADGSTNWSAAEADAVTVAGGPTGELSIRFNAYLDRYVMTYLDQRKAGIVMRESPAPWGPWSAPVVIAQSAQYPQLYGAFMKSGFDAGGGRIFYYMMSQYGSYNTFWMQTTLP
jgi:hypothetical protein